MKKRKNKKWNSGDNIIHAEPEKAKPTETLTRDYESLIGSKNCKVVFDDSIPFAWKHKLIISDKSVKVSKLLKSYSDEMEKREGEVPVMYEN